MNNAFLERLRASSTIVFTSEELSLSPQIQFSVYQAQSRLFQSNFQCVSISQSAVCIAWIAVGEFIVILSEIKMSLLPAIARILGKHKYDYNIHYVIITLKV